MNIFFEVSSATCDRCNKQEPTQPQVLRRTAPTTTGPLIIDDAGNTWQLFTEKPQNWSTSPLDSKKLICKTCVDAWSDTVKAFSVLVAPVLTPALVTPPRTNVPVRAPAQAQQRTRTPRRDATPKPKKTLSPLHKTTVYQQTIQRGPTSAPIPTQAREISRTAVSLVQTPAATQKVAPAPNRVNQTVFQNTKVVPSEVTKAIPAPSAPVKTGIISR